VEITPSEYNIVSIPRPNDFQLQGFKLHTKETVGYDDGKYWSLISFPLGE